MRILFAPTQGAGRVSDSVHRDLQVRIAEEMRSLLAIDGFLTSIVGQPG